jgi:hypothetical protein
MNFKGYNSSNWITKVYVGGDHNEFSWAGRLDVPLLFLLGTEPFVNVETQNLSKKLFSIFPNPSGNILFIKAFDQLKSPVSIFNLLGVEQKISFTAEKGKIDISNLPSGIY